MELLTNAVERWGVEIDAVELKDLDIPENMQRAIAREAEAIREKRARIIKAEGELEAAVKLAEAARDHFAQRRRARTAPAADAHGDRRRAQQRHHHFDAGRRHDRLGRRGNDPVH